MTHLPTAKGKTYFGYAKLKKQCIIRVNLSINHISIYIVQYMLKMTKDIINS